MCHQHESFRYNIGGKHKTTSMERHNGMTDLATTTIGNSPITLRTTTSTTTTTTTSTTTTTETTTTTTTTTSESPTFGTSSSNGIFYFDENYDENDLVAIEDCTSIDCLRKRLPLVDTELNENAKTAVSEETGPRNTVRPSDPKLSRLIGSLTNLLEVLNSTRAKGKRIPTSEKLGNSCNRYIKQQIFFLKILRAIAD